METGRNDPCPCGSGKKYKKCCWDGGRIIPFPSVPEDNDSFEENDENPCNAIADLDLRKADLSSPDYWDLVQSALSEFDEESLETAMLKIKRGAILQSRREEFKEADAILQKHYKAYCKLLKNEKKFFRQAERLFNEEPFHGYRFTRDQLDRAFQEVGYPECFSGDLLSIPHLIKTTNFLVSEERRKEIAVELLVVMLDYVREGRYMDAWIIMDSSEKLDEGDPSDISLFSFCMIMYGYQQWEDHLRQKQEMLFEQLGVDVETFRKEGFENVESWVQQVMDDPAKAQQVDQFMTDHPELKRATETQWDDTYTMACKLLQRPEGAELLLDEQEILPWIMTFMVRCREIGLLDDSPESTDNSPDAEEEQAFEDVVMSVASEMAEAIYTPARLRCLHKQVRAIEKKYKDTGDDELAAGIRGAQQLLRSAEHAYDESEFLLTLCMESLRRYEMAQRGEEWGDAHT